MARFNVEEPDRWISFSDIMTGLMVIFMFIAIAYIIEAQETHKKLEVVNDRLMVKQDAINKILVEYRNNRDTIYKNMVQVFGNDLERWGAQIDKTTLTVRFSGDASEFKPGKDYVPESFAKILDEFIPKYLRIVTSHSYSDEIVEIKVEGHAFNSGQDFMKILAGSQNRARNVLKLIRRHKSFIALPENIKQELDFKLTATGMGYGRMLDSNMQFVAKSKQAICEDCSRRVEFTISTASERAIDNLRKLATND